MLGLITEFPPQPDSELWYFYKLIWLSGHCGVCLDGCYCK
jgi:hypothetical protein